MIERTKRRIIPLSLELALVSERVVHTLSQDRGELNEKDQVVLNKASNFLEAVLRGEEVVRTLKLSRTSVTDLRAYRWALSAYSFLAEKRGDTEKRNLRKVFSEYQSSVSKLRNREEIDEAALKELQDFFGIMLDITTKACARPIERVNIDFC